MRIYVWFVAILGMLMVGCSGVSIAVVTLQGQPLRGLLCNLAGVSIGLSALSYAMATGTNAGPSAGAYLRDLRRRKYSAPPPIKFRCPACGRTYNGTGTLVGTTFQCREKGCGKPFVVVADSPGGPPPAA